MSRFTQDPAAIADMNPLNGVISNLGILYWAAAASVSLFTALMLLAVSSRQGWGQFFLFFGLFTTLLLLDDLFMLHERIFPLVFGIGEKIVLGIYAVILMGGLWTYLPQIRASNYALLLAASFFFGFSVGVDILFIEESHWHHLYEDGAKFLGVAAWAAYFVETAYGQLQPARNKVAID